MKKRKLNIESLQIKSFITEMKKGEGKTIAGGIDLPEITVYIEYCPTEKPLASAKQHPLCDSFAYLFKD